MTAAQLAKAVGCPLLRAVKWLDALTNAMVRYEINTPLRQAAFLAQISHESGRLYYVRELASGIAYEGRKDLGNTQPGDGKRYKGRGLIQVTGRANYKACGDALGLDLITYPELLETPEHAAMSAAWFWHSRKLNQLADAQDFRTITRRINGGYNGLADRMALYDTALQVMEATA